VIFGIEGCALGMIIFMSLDFTWTQKSHANWYCIVFMPAHSLWVCLFFFVTVYSSSLYATRWKWSPFLVWFDSFNMCEDFITAGPSWDRGVNVKFSHVKHNYDGSLRAIHTGTFVIHREHSKYTLGNHHSKFWFVLRYWAPLIMELCSRTDARARYALGNAYESDLFLLRICIWDCASIHLNNNIFKVIGANGWIHWRTEWITKVI
jgi:hypothetical protein